MQLLLVQPRFPIFAGLGSEDAATSSASGSPKARLGASRELWGILVGTMLILCLSLPEPIAASFGDFTGFVERALGPAVLPNFCTT